MIRKIGIFLTFVLFLGGCSALPTKKPELSVSVNSFTMVPGSGMVPGFEIGLHVVNTSPVEIDIAGIVYRIYLQDREIVTGAAHDLPKIPAYGESDIEVTGTPDIFETLGFFRDMMSGKRERIDYLVDVSIDVGGFMPMIHTKKKGTLLLTESSR
ncbi:LEA type 2 family protein [Hydrogenimonas sp.]